MIKGMTFRIDNSNADDIKNDLITFANIINNLKRLTIFCCYCMDATSRTVSEGRRTGMKKSCVGCKYNFRSDKREPCKTGVRNIYYFGECLQYKPSLKVKLKKWLKGRSEADG